jgi:hypothetical protein
MFKTWGRIRMRRRIGIVLMLIRIGTYQHGNLDPDRHQHDADPQHCIVARYDFYLVSSHLPGDFAELFLTGGHYLNTDPPLNLLIHSIIRKECFMSYVTNFAN